MRLRLPDIGWGCGLIILALLMYAGGISAAAFPGESARTLAEHGGLLPRMLPSDPGWNLLMSTCAALSGANYVFCANALSLVLGILDVLLFYVFMLRVLCGYLDRAEVDAREALTGARCGALTSCIALLCSVPFWIISTRAHPLTLSVFLLLLCANLFFEAVVARRWWLLYLSVFVLVVGTMDSRALIGLSPVFAFHILWTLWGRGELTIGRVILMACTALVACSAYVLISFQVFSAADTAVVTFSSGWDVLASFLRSQYVLLVHSLPRVGWVLILSMTTLPWLVAQGVAVRALAGEREWTYYFLHAVFLIVIVLVLCNVSFSPLGLGGYSRLLVTPYLITAMLSGYLAAYLYQLWPNERAVASGKLRIIRIGVVAPLLMFLAATGWRNIEKGSTRGINQIERHIQQIIRDAGDREWLISDGALDSNLRLALRASDTTLRLFSLQAGADTAYLNWVSQQFPNPAIQAMSQVGMEPMLRLWLRDPSVATGKVALYGVPEFWNLLGYSSRPYGLVNIAEAEAKLSNDPGLPNYMDADVSVLLSIPEDAPLYAYSRHVLQRLALQENNVGVYLQDKGSHAEAVIAYRRAYNKNPDNLSALLNLNSMVNAGHLKDSENKYKNALATFEEGSKATLPLWQLSQTYGYVRNPSAYLAKGWSWILSGRPGAAVHDIRRAIELAGDKDVTELKAMLASLYARAGKDEKAAELLGQLLEHQPQDIRSHIALLLIALRGGDVDIAEAHLLRVRKSGAPKHVMNLLQARIFIARKKYSEAEQLLLSLTNSGQPGSEDAYILLGGIALTTGNNDLLRRVAGKLVRIPGAGIYGLTLLGEMAEKSGELSTARQYYLDAVRLAPKDVRLYEQLLRLDMIQSRKEDAREHARLILDLDLDHAMANYVLGTIYMSEGDMNLAEVMLRRSLSFGKHPDTLNHLAWLLSKKSAYVEAGIHAKQAVAASPENGLFWDTLGLIELKTGRLELAQTALMQARSLLPEHPEIKLHIAELLIAQERPEEAREILAEVRAKAGNLPPELLRRVKEIEASVDF